MYRLDRSKRSKLISLNLNDEYTGMIRIMRYLDLKATQMKYIVKEHFSLLNEK